MSQEKDTVLPVDVVETKKTELKDNLAQGIFWFLMSNIAGSFTQTIAKYCFLMHSDLNVVQLLWYRAIISMILLTLYLNTSLKKYMFDEVSRDNILPVAIRTCQVTFSLFVGYQAL